ncbi:MAG: S24 family peptidase [Thiotrichales bacterium]
MDEFYSACASSEPFALQVLGNSMEPEFEDGCIVIIDRSARIEHGCYVLAKHQDEYIFRQLKIEGEQWRLAPLNPHYETLVISSKDAIEGVIIQKAGRRRSQHKHYT